MRKRHKSTRRNKKDNSTSHSIRDTTSRSGGIKIVGGHRWNSLIEAVVDEPRDVTELALPLLEGLGIASVLTGPVTKG